MTKHGSGESENKSSGPIHEKRGDGGSAIYYVSRHMWCVVVGRAMVNTDVRLRLHSRSGDLCWK